MSNASNKLRLAVQQLTQAGSQRERLAKAVETHLACLRPSDLPVEVRPHFTQLINGICDGRVQQNEATVARMLTSIPDAEINAMMESIIGMYDALTRHETILTIGEAI